MLKSKLELCKAYLLDIVFPNRCPFCEDFIEWDKCVCDSCRTDIQPAIERICHKCGKYPCCCDGRKSYDEVYAALFYDDDKVNDAIYDFKHSGMENLAEYTVEIVEEYLIGKTVDYVTAVPMGKRKQQKRGHNQADILARCVGRCLDIKATDNLLFKKDSKEEQHHLSSAERAENAGKLFSGSDKDLTGKTIILCDDVMTTGSTLEACASILKKMGAGKVIVVVCATTKIDESQKKGDQ